VYAATGRRFSARQFHLFRLADGRLAEHIAVRDDLTGPCPSPASHAPGLMLAEGLRPDLDGGTLCPVYGPPLAVGDPARVCPTGAIDDATPLGR
jgi:hypothetical protein